MTELMISVDQICKAVEQTLRSALPMVLDLPEVKAYLGREAKDYKPINDWQQLPIVTAIVKGSGTSVAIASPGLVERPRYVRSKNAWEATWAVAIGFYDRGTDHEATQAKVRNWVSFARIALQRNRTLGGIAKATEWVGEEFDLLPGRNTARTVAAGALAIEVTVDVPDTLVLGLPPVASTNTELSVQTQE